MKKFVFWAGIYNIVGGIGFFFPGIGSLLGFQLPKSNFWLWFWAGALIYAGIVLIFCSRNLAARASLVYLQGIMNIFGFFLLAGFGFLGDLGIFPGVFGIIALLIGLVYLIGVPKTLNTTAANLLLDRGEGC